MQPRSTSTRPVVPSIPGMLAGAGQPAFQHEFRPVTPRILSGGSVAAAAAAASATGAGMANGQPVVAGYRPSSASGSSGASSGGSSMSGSSSDPFEKRGVISTALAEARALVQHMDQTRGARPASLTEVSRPYTPRLARRSAPYNPAASPSPDPFPAPPDSPAPLSNKAPLSNPAFSPPLGAMTSPLRSDDDDMSEELLGRAAVSAARPSSGSRPASAKKKRSVSRTRDGSGVEAEPTAVPASSSASRPSSSTTAAAAVAGSRSRSASTASPHGFNARRSPVPALALASSASASAAAFAVPALAFPVGAGSDDDWRFVEQQADTSRPGTAMGAPPLSRQGSGMRTAPQQQPQQQPQSFSSPSPPPQPRPPSGSPARPRSRPNSSSSPAPASPFPADPFPKSDITVEMRSFDGAVSAGGVAATAPPATSRQNSGLFARPLLDGAPAASGTERPASATASATAGAAVSPEPAAAAGPALDLAGLRALHDSYTRAGVASQPDLLRELLAASYRSLQSARQAPVVAGLVRFVLHLPSPGDSGARLQLLAAKLLFEVSREPRNDALLLAIWPEVVSRVLARPAQTGLKGLSYALGALHNLSVEASSNSSGSTAQSPLVSQALVDALGNLLRPQVHRALKLPEPGVPSPEGAAPASASEEGVVKLLVEVTGALRNVASMHGAPALFCNAVALPPLASAPTGSTASAASPEDCCLDLLCHVSQRHWAQGSLLLNVVRILAKLSLHEQCRTVMYAPTTLPPPLLPLASSSAAPAAPSAAVGPTGFLPALVSALQVHHAKLSVCVRILYVLGNLTMQHDACRVAIADCACPAVGAGAGPDASEAAAAAGAGEDRELRGWEVLLNLLARSYQRDSKLRKLLAAPAAAGAASGASTKPSSSATADAAAASSKKHTTMLRENEELLVKLVRLLANLCINPQAGARIAGDRRVANLVKLLRVKSVESSEELVLNTVSAVTNLSFYLKPAAAAAASRPASASAPSSSTTDTKGSLLLFHPPRDVLALLLSNLFSANTELLSETLRCLGNFSRDLPFRLMMSQARADEAVLLLLHHGDCGVVYGAAGVVLNMAAHAGPGQEALWADQGAPLHALLDAMERFGGGGDAAAEDGGDDAQDGEEEPEWGLLAMILKTFLNLRCAPPGETRSDSGSGSAAAPAPAEMVLRREVDAQVRAHLSYVLEAVLERCEAEVAALHAQLDTLVPCGGGGGGSGGGSADGDEDAPSPAALHAMLRVVGEVESLAQQLLPACIMPAPWQNDQ